MMESDTGGTRPQVQGPPRDAATSGSWVRRGRILLHALRGLWPHCHLDLRQQPPGLGREVLQVDATQILARSRQPKQTHTIVTRTNCLCK